MRFAGKAIFIHIPTIKYAKMPENNEVFSVIKVLFICHGIMMINSAKLEISSI